METGGEKNLSDPSLKPAELGQWGPGWATNFAFSWKKLN